MGILPLRLPAEFCPDRLKLQLGDVVEVAADPATISPRCPVPVTILRKDGSSFSFGADAAVETNVELRTLKAGGLLPFILDEVLRSPGNAKSAKTSLQ
ncbi:MULTISPECIES: hypothetical protein [Sinorhizobium]|uniref:hypothetical protein n=1 Tax=Sinorhizobium sp. CCBAU 05631 TaxID=794846 RepID=UPI0004AFBA51|nr:MULTISPECIES: hypothetical protein [Sinorhizobium]ASY59390.1 Aconitate hydratase [Sinorhizobium sp. CCBAU 05631]